MQRERLYILILLASPLVVLGILEVSLRVLWPQPPRGFSEALFEQRDGLTFVRRGAAGAQNGREFRVRVAGDDRGYRDGLSSPPGSGSDRFWVFGDSFGFGWGVEAHETASAILRAHGISVANFCMPGDGLEDYVRRLHSARSSASPPAGIILLLYDNDLAEFLPPGSAPPADDPTVRPWRDRAARLQIVRLAGLVFDTLGVSHWIADRTGYREHLKGILARDFVIYRRDPSRLKNLSRAMQLLSYLLSRAGDGGTPVWVVRIVPFYVVGESKIQEALEILEESSEEFEFHRLDGLLASLCERRGARYLRFAATSPEEEQTWYFPHDLHLTPAGQHALADQLQALIRG